MYTHLLYIYIYTQTHYVCKLLCGCLFGYYCFVVFSICRRLLTCFWYQASMDALDKCRIHYCMLLTGVEITASGHVQIAFAVKRLWIQAGFIGSGALEGSKRSKGQKIALHHPKGQKRLYPGTLFPKGQVCRFNCIRVYY